MEAFLHTVQNLQVWRNANREVMMQYHNWDITIILTLGDTQPFYNNFCSYKLGNMIFAIAVTASQYALCLLLNALV